MNLTSLSIPEFNSLNEVIHYISLIVSIGLVVSTLELAFLSAQFKDTGLLSWKIWREHKLRKKEVLKKYSSFFLNRTSTLIMLALRFLVLMLFLYQLCTGAGLVLSTVSLLLITQFYFNYRLPVGKDGSDQMSNIILVCLFFIAAFPENKVIVIVSVLFIAFQALLSYLTSGISKIVSPTWRQGNIVFKIFNTKTYGSKSIAKFLRHRPSVVKFMNHSTLVFECLILLVLFIPYPFNLYFLIIPFMFHLASARIMGLNSFLFAFSATFPAIVYLSNKLQHVFSLVVDANF